MSRTYVIGDIHGHYDALVRLLREKRLIDQNLQWAGGKATLYFMGDFFDRGTDGVSVLALVMRLEREARAAGGRVQALLGNHDAMLLSVAHFGKLNQKVRIEETIDPGEMDIFTEVWLLNGGIMSDLARLTPEHIEWITNLPAMLKVNDRIFVHADAMLYIFYGHSPKAVNEAIGCILKGRDITAWDSLLERFSEHGAFYDYPDELDHFLRVYGGKQVIHGHTPIMNLTDQFSEEVTKALVYNNGRCVNVDHGLYRGGPGFIYELPEE